MWGGRTSGDLAPTIEPVVSSRNLAGTNGALHSHGSCHGIFSTHPNAVEEQNPGIKDHPSIQAGSPRGGEQDKTQKHDGSILDETKATANPISDETDQDLANGDPKDFEVVDRLDPRLGADLVGLPAGRKGGFEEGANVADGEEDVPVSEVREWNS